ncbi:hypothetical protein LOY67_17100 [Pseudomonas sp. B21-056]|uniref:hypothetical protein n=1 Tax=Pseudomonas sp. B21-056 TaxID=2895495 RepID=UPI0022320300|nr:hypothetical protein [Pseudomonas sp. B21-056]UZE21764.1 hypothetical protein LOY67_17100 [Pseudomonas sp. B21-056]
MAKPKISAVQTAEPVGTPAAKPKVPAKAKAAAKPSAVAKSKTPSGKAASSKQIHNSHSDAAERMMQLAQLLLEDPKEAKLFAKKTGVYTNAGELTAAYR